MILNGAILLSGIACLGIGMLIGKFFFKKTKLLEKLQERKLSKILSDPEILKNKLTQNGTIKPMDMGEELDYQVVQDPINPGKKILTLSKSKFSAPIINPESIKEKSIKKKRRKPKNILSLFSKEDILEATSPKDQEELDSINEEIEEEITREMNEEDTTQEDEEDKIPNISETKDQEELDSINEEIEEEITREMNEEDTTQEDEEDKIPNISETKDQEELDSINEEIEEEK
jgi:hypothetical protein